jgi:hypothetical protein
MGLRCENDRKRLDTGTSVPARGGFEPVSHLKATEGAANTGHLSSVFSSQTGRFASNKPKTADLRIPSRQNGLCL